MTVLLGWLDDAVASVLTKPFTFVVALLLG
jgi:F0F1-type ATP synthase assembly protein I